MVSLWIEFGQFLAHDMVATALTNGKQIFCLYLKISKMFLKFFNFSKRVQVQTFRLLLVHVIRQVVDVIQYHYRPTTHFCLLNHVLTLLVRAHRFPLSIVVSPIAQLIIVNN